MKFKTSWQKALGHVVKCHRGRFIKGHSVIESSKSTYNGRFSKSDVEIKFYPKNGILVGNIGKSITSKDVKQAMED